MGLQFKPLRMVSRDYQMRAQNVFINCLERLVKALIKQKKFHASTRGLSPSTRRFFTYSTASDTRYRRTF